MKALFCLLCSFLLVSEVCLPPSVESQEQPATAKPFVLEDGTPVRIRISQTVSSADAHVNDRVEFEVLEDIKVQDIVVVPKGGIAWGTVTEAMPKRRMGRAGKLEIVMDSVRLADGQKAALRATKEAKGGSHVGGMTIGIVAAAVVFWPAAPLFLLIHGKDITIPKGTDVQTFINGDMKLDSLKFQQAESGPQPQAAPANTSSGLFITSNPTSADIFLDQNFVGDTPSTISVPAGKHTVSVRKSGFQDWAREMNFSGGTITLVAEMVPVAATSSAAPEQTAPSAGEGNPPTSAAPPQAAPTSNLEVELGRIGVQEITDVGLGVKIKKLANDGPAGKAHLLAGDTITAINGAPTTSSTALASALANLPSGTHVRVNYLRSAFGENTALQAEIVLTN